jgi:hypothetical protein
LRTRDQSTRHVRESSAKLRTPAPNRIDDVERRAAREVRALETRHAREMAHATRERIALDARLRLDRDALQVGSRHRVEQPVRIVRLECALERWQRLRTNERRAGGMQIRERRIAEQRDAAAAHQRAFQLRRLGRSACTNERDERETKSIDARDEHAHQ